MKKYIEPIVEIEKFSNIDLLNTSEEGVLDFNEDWLSGGNNG